MVINAKMDNDIENDEEFQEEKELFQTPLNSPPSNYELEEAQAVESIRDDLYDGDIFITPSPNPEDGNNNQVGDKINDNTNNVLLQNALDDANLTDSFMADIPLKLSPTPLKTDKIEEVTIDPEQSAPANTDLLTLQANINEKFALLTEQLKTNFRDYDNRISQLEELHGILKQNQDQSTHTLSSLSASSLLQEESFDKMKYKVDNLTTRLDLITDGKVEQYVKRIIKENIPPPPQPPPPAIIDEQLIKRIVLQNLPPPPPPPTPPKVDEQLLQKKIDEAVAQKIERALKTAQYPQQHQHQRPQQHSDVKLKRSASSPLFDRPLNSHESGINENIRSAPNNIHGGGLSMAFHSNASSATSDTFGRTSTDMPTMQTDANMARNTSNNNIPSTNNRNNNHLNNSNNNLNNIHTSSVNNIKCDFLIIGDSNVQKLNPSMMGKATCQILWAPHIFDATELIKNISMVQPPKYLLLNVGLNDLNQPLIQTTNRIDQLILAVKAKFPPTTTVSINSILRRGDERFHEESDELNRYIERKCVANIKFLHHHNIRHNEHMEDHLHLDKVGLHIFISNIKFGVLGILPNLSKQRYMGGRRQQPRPPPRRHPGGHGRSPQSGNDPRRNNGPGGGRPRRYSPPQGGSGYNNGGRRRDHGYHRGGGSGSYNNWYNDFDDDDYDSEC